MTAIEDITRTVATYVDGMVRGDADALGRAFHPNAAVIGHFDGGLEWTTVAEFAATCSAEAIPKGTIAPAHTIEAISIAGDTAVVRVVNEMAGLNFHDTLSLLCHEGRWQIVSKVFLQLP